MSVISKCLVGAVLVLLIGLGLQHLTLIEVRHDLKGAQDEATTAATDRDDWKAAAEQRSQDVENVLQRSEQTEQAVRRLQGRVAELEARYAPVRRTIREALPSEDGPVAPVLRQALEQLP